MFVELADRSAGGGAKHRRADRHRPGTELLAAGEPFLRPLLAAVVSNPVVGDPVALALDVISLALLDGDVDPDRLGLRDGVGLKFLHRGEGIGTLLAKRNRRHAAQRVGGVGPGLVEVRDPRGEFFRLKIIGFFPLRIVADNFCGGRKIFGQAAHLGFHVGGELAQQPRRAAGSQFGQAGMGRVLRLRVGDILHVEAGTLQKTGECVVVLGQDGVELVVVAAGATHRQPEEGLGVNVDLVVHAVALVSANVHRRVGRLAQVPKAGALRGLVAASGRVDAGPLHHVAGDVLDDELIVRHVGVEGADDVVAIAVCLGDRVVALVAARLGEAHQVEPVLPPAFAEVRRGEQSLDELRVGVGRGVVDVCLDLRRCRRQADEVEVQPADKCAAGCRGAWRKPGALQLGEDEAVHGGVGPVRAGDRLDLWRPDVAPNRLPRPVPGRELGEVEFVFVADVRRVAVARVGRAHGDPLGQFVDGLLRELGLGRHLQIGVTVRDSPDQQAVPWVAGDDRRADFPALEQPGAGVELQFALGFAGFLAVAFVAVLHQQRPDVVLEKLDSLRLSGGQAAWPNGPSQAKRG